MDEGIDISDLFEEDQTGNYREIKEAIAAWWYCWDK